MLLLSIFGKFHRFDWSSFGTLQLPGVEGGCESAPNLLVHAQLIGLARGVHGTRERSELEYSVRVYQCLDLGSVFVMFDSRSSFEYLVYQSLEPIPSTP